MTGVYNLPVAFRFEGNVEKAQQLTGQARKYLGLLAESMSFAKLKFLTREFQDADGNVFRCMINAIGLAPIVQVVIYAGGGGEIDILEGFIVRMTAELNIQAPQVIYPLEQIGLSVRWLENPALDDDTYAEADFIQPETRQSINVGDAVNYDGEPSVSQPESSYYLYRFPSGSSPHEDRYPFVYTGTQNITSKATASGVSGRVGTVDVSVELAAGFDASNDYYVAETKITQSATSPRVRFYGADYEINDGVVFVKPTYQGYDEITANPDFNKCFAVVKKNTTFSSEYISPPQPEPQNISAYMLDILFPSMPSSELYTPGDYEYTGDPVYIVNSTLSTPYSMPDWKMQNDVKGHYEITIQSAEANQEVDVDFLWFGTKYPNKMKLKMKTTDQQITPGGWYKSEKKVIVFVEYPAQFEKNGINPHIKIVAND